jgi:hypothetical protein
MSETVIYWACGHDSMYKFDLNHMHSTPQSLYHELFLKRSFTKDNLNNYLSCPAVSDLLNNIFVIRAPVSTDADLDFSNSTVKYNFDSYLDERKYKIELLFRHQPTLLNHNLIEYIHPTIFLAEDPSLIATLTPPYFDHVTSSSYGCIVPGSFDIGKWFREMNLEFQLWPNINTIKIPYNEALCYVHFQTDKKIVLKRFIITPELDRIRHSLTRVSPFRKYARLSDRYSVFERSRTKERILRIISNNLV